MAELKRTPLYELHIAAGAKMVDFGGWEMPVQYSGIIDEHQTVRQAAGLFDVSHMGEITVKGPGALAFLEKLLPNQVARLAKGQILYSPMCYEHGGTVDDLLVYKEDAEEYLLVVNAGNTDKDYEWIKQLAPAGVEVENISHTVAQLAIQGPQATAILKPLTPVQLDAIRYYWFTRGEVAGIPCIISRTGYTGEDGWELYCSPDQARQLWQTLLTAGQDKGIKPIGLGARDTLRFEAAMPLYGHELSEDITPLEAGLKRFIALDKPEDFIGKTALTAQAEAGLKRKLVGLEMVERGIARQGYPVVYQGQEIGMVTSGTMAPTLGKNLAMALIAADVAQTGQEVAVMIRNKEVKAKIVSLPFYKRGR
ncbi:MULTISPECIES: glycine cleavage system aminomethyltransferase GcvT [unclassified Carboxydocella]|uniref:glycine cleavage system aminomethyltransferase GcvT n=1 Tax=unclassified Carboxydocella TaxID=2685367 RepID=UPI0009AD4ADE|nr:MULTISPECIES: glycine cleavage system aminomethyltransferase GcvT [unclassified Carboxydocella]GAW27839.1 glycine cleavage system protein T [Carboxydocella sp. ULO1]GAW32296.1 glycine cleavage system protein T [Carboxydocella sp. JDF658]